MEYLMAIWMAARTLLPAWAMDRLWGDPPSLPHPIVWFGKAIAWGEHRWNHGSARVLKGGLMAVALIVGVYLAVWGAAKQLAAVAAPLGIAFELLCIFFCLAGTTLIREVRMVFRAVDRSLEEGRSQVPRIVGRDTSALSAQEVRTAALETLAENLSDGVIAPLFWYLWLGVPGMMAYKMVNTLDSMIGYRNERYAAFGRIAARIDDAANYLPARLTALLMILAARKPSLLAFVRRFGRAHASPNSGYPEAALAGILQCRFGGPHLYFGQLFDKPFIGTNERPLHMADMHTAIAINRRAELLMLILTLFLRAGRLLFLPLC